MSLHGITSCREHFLDARVCSAKNQSSGLILASAAFPRKAGIQKVPYLKAVLGPPFLMAVRTE